MKIASKVTKDMIEYYNSDVNRINHALKVYGFAKCIGELEDIKEQETLELTAILHDIGIPDSERLYNSSAAKYQEIIGPKVAASILEKYNLPEKVLDRIYYIIGNHHTYDKIDGIDFQILVEADFLVNIFEGNYERAKIEMVKEKFFKTKTGLDLIDSLYLDNAR